MEEKIMTLHPKGKKGVNISKAKYDLMRATILEIVGATEGITFREMTQVVGEKLAGKFEGSIGWYTTVVKLDLEARGTIERVPNSQPQQLRLG